MREDYWRPRLKRFGQLADWVLSFVSRLRSRVDRNELGETLQEKAARHPASNIILSRIKRRPGTEDLASFYRVLIEIGAGEFESFEHRVKDEKRSPGDVATIAAFDFNKAESHSILGKRFNLIDVLPSALNNVAVAFSMGTLAQAAEAPAEEIAKARDDAQNAVQIGQSLYEALEWIYGPGAFGLRLFAWFARKAPDDLIDKLILAMVRLRAVPDAILPSEQIAEMAKQAKEVRDASKRYERLWREDPRYRQVLDPKRVRAAFADHIMLKLWKEEVKAAGTRPLPTPSGKEKP